MICGLFLCRINKPDLMSRRCFSWFLFFWFGCGWATVEGFWLFRWWNTEKIEPVNHQMLLFTSLCIKVELGHEAISWLRWRHLNIVFTLFQEESGVHEDTNMHTACSICRFIQPQVNLLKTGQEGEISQLWWTSAHRWVCTMTTMSHRLSDIWTWPRLSSQPCFLHQTESLFIQRGSVVTRVCSAVPRLLSSRLLCQVRSSHQTFTFPLRRATKTNEKLNLNLFFESEVVSVYLFCLEELCFISFWTKIDRLDFKSAPLPLNSWRSLLHRYVDLDTECFHFLFYMTLF